MSEPLRPWREQPPQPSSAAEVRAAAAFASAAVTDPDEIQLRRVWRRIAARVPQVRQGAPAVPTFWRPRPVMAAVCLLGAFSAGASIATFRRLHRPSAAPAQATAMAEVRSVSAAPPPAVEVPPPAVAPIPVPVPVPAVVAAPAPLVRPSQMAPARPTGVVAESQLLQSALQHLNVLRDPQGALALLDAYDTRFPTGVLHREAEVARMDANLRLGRTSEALAILDGAARLGFEGYPRAARLQVARGELLSQSGRCREALAMFSGVGADPEAGERALAGEVYCLSVLGEQAQSRAGMERYLAAYPSGPRAAEMRRALAP